ncbi:MAG: TspO/MBR family protein [bacterium]|nr:TspO/MBR family protein [bacterium]
MFKSHFFKELDFVKLFWSLVLCFGAGFLGSIYTAPAISIWYAELNKPSLTPPNWVFGYVWGALYFLMAYSFYLIWLKGWQEKEIRFSMEFFLAHLLVMAGWSAVFFGAKEVMLAFIVILTLWSLILFLMLNFYKQSRLAAYLLVPYLIWVGYATVLNFYIVILN